MVDSVVLKNQLANMSNNQDVATRAVEYLLLSS